MVVSLRFSLRPMLGEDLNFRVNKGDNCLNLFFFADVQQRFDVLRCVNPWHQVCLVCQVRYRCIGVIVRRNDFLAYFNGLLKILNQLSPTTNATH